MIQGWSDKADVSFSTGIDGLEKEEQIQVM